MSVFGHAIRIINENESPLPVTKLSHEPSPFDTGGCEVKSSMTYILKKDAEKPGKRGTLFGKEKRDRGPVLGPVTKCFVSCYTPIRTRHKM